MPYDDVKHVCVSFETYDFGAAADEVMSFRLPTGYSARLVKIGCMVTEIFAGSSTGAIIQLGTAADNDAYAELIIATATADEDFWDETDDPNAILAEDIAADVLLEVNLIQIKGGTVTGQGRPMFWFELYK